MSMTTCEADGAVLSGMDLPVSRPPISRPKDEIVAGLQLVAGAALAVGLMVSPHNSSEAKTLPAAVAATTLAPLVTPEGLAGPPEGFMAGLDSKAILHNLMRQAGLRANLDPRRLSWDQARRVNALMPIAGAALEPARPFRIDVRTKDGRQALKCLTEAAYYEAGASGPAAEAAVTQVVLNRVRHPDFPKTVCGVVYQGSERDTGCQFTFTCDGALSRPIDKAAWDRAREVAARALSGYVVRAVGASTYYHADYVFPTWAPTLQKMATVGPHIFYRITGAEGSAAILSARYAGGELKLVKAMLRAEDRAAPKPSKPEGRVQVVMTASSGAASPASAAMVQPAGLTAQAARIQRMREMLAAGTLPTDGSKVASVETAPPAAPAPPATASVTSESPAA